MIHDVTFLKLRKQNTGFLTIQEAKKMVTSIKIDDFETKQKRKKPNAWSCNNKRSNSICWGFAIQVALS
jgi:hypothetical protein